MLKDTTLRKKVNTPGEKIQPKTEAIYYKDIRLIVRKQLKSNTQTGGKRSLLIALTIKRKNREAVEMSSTINEIAGNADKATVIAAGVVNPAGSPIYSM